MADPWIKNIGEHKAHEHGKSHLTVFWVKNVFDECIFWPGIDSIPGLLRAKINKEIK
jgi:hypothetical protein